MSVVYGYLYRQLNWRNGLFSPPDSEAANSIQAIKGDKKVYILVRHLEFDNAYNDSILPYQVYKIQAFNDDEEKNKGRHSLHFVVGYNFRDTSFACVPIDEFVDKRSTVVHQREGLRAIYYNNWNALKKYVV